MGEKRLSNHSYQVTFICFRVLISIASRNAFNACLRQIISGTNTESLQHVKKITIRHRDFLASSTIPYKFGGLNEYSLYLRNEST